MKNGCCASKIMSESVKGAYDLEEILTPNCGIVMTSSETGTTTVIQP